MSKVINIKEYYWMRQCTLAKDQDGASRITVCWIPEKYAKVGKLIGIKGVISGLWEEGWRVCVVGQTRKHYNEVFKRAQDYKNTRDASDI